MQVFLSWSGYRSRSAAEALRDWLPLMIQAVRPWMSAVDVLAGSQWASEVAFALKESKFGILCLTPENLNAPWVLFEAGVLFHSINVCPYLVGFSDEEFDGPLSQFQAVRADRAGTEALVMALNRVLGDNAVAEQTLKRLWDAFLAGA